MIVHMSFEYRQTINQHVQLTRRWLAVAAQQSTQIPAADNLRVTYARVDASILRVPSDRAFVSPDTQAVAECVLATDRIMQIFGVQLGTNAQGVRAVTRADSPAHGTIQLPIFGCAFCRAR